MQRLSAASTAAPAANLREQMRDKTAISRFLLRGNRGLDESWSDLWVLTVQDGFSDAFMSSDWLSTKFAAPFLIASRSEASNHVPEASSNL